MESAELNKIKLEVFESLAENMKEKVFYQVRTTSDFQSTFTYLSKNITQYSSHSIEEIYQNPNLLYDTILPEYKNWVLKEQLKSFQQIAPLDIQFPIYDSSQNIRWLSVKSTPIKQPDGSVHWNGIQTDITESKEFEARIQKQNRILNLLNRINDTILSITDESFLLERIAHCIIETGGYKLVWICSAPDDNNPNKLVKPLVAYGNTGYLNEINIELDNPDMNNGPTARALRFSKITVTNNFDKANYFTPWLKKANKYGLNASLVLPIELNKRKGAINIYSDQPDAFDEEEVELLNRIAHNITNATQSIESEKQRLANYTELNERIKELKTIYEVNNILSKHEDYEPQIFQEIVNFIPPGFQFSEICEAKIEFNHEVFATAGFKKSHYSLIKEFRTDDGKIGSIEVVYISSNETILKEAFLKEEHALIDALVNMIKLFYHRHVTMQNLKISEANIKTVFNSSHIRFCLVDRYFKVLMINEVFVNDYQSITGHKIAYGDYFNAYVKPERKIILDNYLKQIINEETETLAYEVSYMQGEKEIFINSSYFPVRIDNKIAAVLLVGEEVTEKKKADKERKLLIDDLILRNNELEQFAFIISHNLRAPVANIIGLNSILQEVDSESERKHIFEMIDKSVTRLDEVISDLNNILKIKREVNEKKESVLVRKIVMQVYESIDSLIRETKTEINLDIDAKLEIKTIKSFIMSIFLNLFTNSIKYAKPNQPPHIAIKAVVENNQLIIRYKDEGMGIDLSKYGNSLFGLYQRFHTHKEGKGVGLYMVKKQIEVLGGKITVESEVGNGIQFTIILPLENNN